MSNAKLEDYFTLHLQPLSQAKLVGFSSSHTKRVKQGLSANNVILQGIWLEIITTLEKHSKQAFETELVAQHHGLIVNGPTNNGLPWPVKLVSSYRTVIYIWTSIHMFASKVGGEGR